jgi:uncharacterized Zn finger protein
MSKSDIEMLEAAIQKTWPGKPSSKAQRYVGAFFDAVRVAERITAKVVGNHGTYTVSVEAQDGQILSACSCYIGKGGYCHHCEALAATFMQNPSSFKEMKLKKRDEIHRLADVQSYLQSVTLDALLKQLGENGITQKALAESVGMNPRHLSTIKSSEARHHYFNELGVAKLACLWMLEHLAELNSD